MQIEESIINNERRECMQTNDDYIFSRQHQLTTCFLLAFANMKDTLSYHYYQTIYSDHRKLLCNFIFEITYRLLSTSEGIRMHNK
jgi:hypothetical protein